MNPHRFTQLAATSARDLLRDNRTVLIMVVSFLGLLTAIEATKLLIPPGGGVRDSVTLTLLPTTLTIGLAAIAFTGTSVPIVRHRQAGTLRVLATTPAGKLTFLAAQAPIRFVIAALEISVVLVLAAYEGATRVALVTAAVGGLLGFAMLLSFGLLIGSRMRNSDFANVLSAILPVIAVTTSSTLPFTALLPLDLRYIINLAPTSWLSTALNLSSAPEGMPKILLAWLAMAAITIISAGVAARTFRWR